MKNERMMELLIKAVDHIETFEESESENVLKSLGFDENDLAEIKFKSESLARRPENISNRRLDALRNYKENEELLTRAAEEQKQIKVNSLISEIKALKPRIDDLIATGNACVQNNIPLRGQGFGMVESYDTHQFFTNSWSHLVGFVNDSGIKVSHIEFLGINGGGACGPYNFRTDGESVFSISEKYPRDIITPSIADMEKFLNMFDQFESSFYSYVDKTIEKQKKSVDKLIDTAKEKASKQNDSSKRDKYEIEH